LDNVELVAGMSVLDIGCGCGASAIAAKLGGAKIAVANDIDEGMKKNLNYVQKNLERPGIEPGAFHMQSERSTTELHPRTLKLKLISYLFLSGTGGG
jgi:predicted RNA methylase